MTAPAPEVRAVVFDWGGVLTPPVDRAIEAAMSTALAAHGSTVVTEGLLRRMLAGSRRSTPT